MTTRMDRLEQLADVRLELRRAPAGEELAQQTGPRRFSMLAYTGNIFDRWFGKAVIDLEGIELPADGEGLAIFRQHAPTQYIGRGDQLAVEAEGLMVGGFLFEDVAAAKEVAAISDQGGRWQASVGIDPLELEELAEGATAEVNGQEVIGPLVIYRRTVLRESSFVPHGADSATTAVALAQNKERQMPDPAQTKQDPIKAERERVSALRQAFAKAPEFALEAIEKGLSLTEAKAARADRLEEQLAAQAQAEAKLREELEAERKRAADARPNPAAMLAAPGGTPAEELSDDPIDRWNHAIKVELEELRQNGAIGLRNRSVYASEAVNLRAQAIHNVSAREPELREAYVVEFNKRRASR